MSKSIPYCLAKLRAICSISADRPFLARLRRF
nr:MAG TPA: hypothetical protein [Caudoviricetes sp.]